MESIRLVALFCNARTGHFGAGAHMDELLYHLRNDPRIKLTIISTDDQSVEEVTSQITEKEAVLRIPMPDNGLYLTCQDTEIQLTYAKRISEFIIEFVYSDVEDQLVVLVNSCDFLNVCRSIKNQIICKLLYVHHSWAWKTCLNLPDLEAQRILLSANSKLGNVERALKSSLVGLIRFQKEIAALSDHVVTVTDQARSFFIDSLGFDKGKITTIYNGVSFSKFTPLIKSRARAELDILPSDQVLLYVGRIKEDKGVGVLIDAFKELKQKHSSLKLIIVGGGDFKEFVRRGFPYFSSIFFTGELDRSLIQTFYCASDIGVIPSLHEQCSFTAIEMRYFKLPAVVSAVDGLDEMFEDNVDSIKVNCTLNDFGFRMIGVQSLISALDVLLGQQDLAERLAEASYRKAISKFTAAEMYEGYASVIVHLCRPII